MYAGDGHGGGRSVTFPVVKRYVHSRALQANSLPEKNFSMLGNLKITIMVFSKAAAFF